MKTLLISFLLVTSVQASQLTDEVNLLIGTGPSNVIDGVPGGKGGGTQPGAVLPFGMINFGPDTDRPEQSGYDHTNDFIRGFSLTHLSGPGCRNSGELPFISIKDKAVWPTPGLRFQKGNQTTRPGYYKVRFDDNQIVELSATRRTGMARITYPIDSKNPGLLFSTKRNGVGDTRGSIKQTGPNILEGSVQGGDFCAARNFYTVYFKIEVNSPIRELIIKDGITSAYFSPKTRELLVKFAISYVSNDGASKNLSSENSIWDFDQIKSLANNEWEKSLSTIQVSGGKSQDERTLFYTSLYRSLLHPNLASDVDGKYIGFDQKIHQAINRDRYHNFSGWDIYRSQVQLVSFLFPKIASDMAQSLVDSGSECGALPKWAQNNAETSIMVGDPGSVSVANFKAFGAEDFDHNKALELMLKSAFDPNANCQGKMARPGLKEYLELGYIPEPTKDVWGPAATTLEYTIADFAVGKFAQELHKSEIATKLFKRSSNWKNLFDQETKLIRPKVSGGNFITPFNPTSLTGFVEGNSHQYSWMIPFDANSLIENFGGGESAVKKLNLHLTQLNGGLSTPYLYIGNEPCFNTPWMYLWAKRPDLTQSINRRILNEEFKNSPGGLPGNDDLGALGSFYVWTSLGLFPSIPGVGGFSIASPTFPRIEITPRGSSRKIILKAEGAEVSSYVKSLNAAGEPWMKPWIDFKDLIELEELDFEMAPNPQMWGQDANYPMPSGEDFYL